MTQEQIKDRITILEQEICDNEKEIHHMEMEVIELEKQLENKPSNK